MICPPSGILAPSAGDMLVCGESVCTEGSLDRIRSQVGVCPQFDMLWGELTGMEHLVVAGHVKGLPFSTVSTAPLLAMWLCTGWLVLALREEAFLSMEIGDQANNNKRHTGLNSVLLAAATYGCTSPMKELLFRV